jgi:hypothetical protein
MAKEKVKHLSGVFASVFAHAKPINPGFGSDLRYEVLQK